MSYEVGVDLGTTYTAAAVHRDGRAAICSLADRGAAIPSVVLLREDGSFLTGMAAERRAATEPERVVREFKRRFGDSTPIIVAGSPYSAEALSARLLEAVVAQVTEREGGPPERIVITYPANWGDYKKELLDQMVRLAGLDPDQVGFITEPEAAALSYAAQERVEPGEVVAVYDLGGGTFDAAVLRRTTNGFSIAGRPEGIERLGGIDFDAAVFAHVANLLGDAITDLDPDDPSALAAVSRLRRDCVDAKEALSADVDASIPVLLPTKQTEVRITRSELEGLIRPSLLDSLEAMKRAVRSADLELEEVSRVLLVGGSSRIPVVSQMVASELGRPLAVDAHPKHAVAVGAAYAAGGLLDSAGPMATSLGIPAGAPPAGAPAPPRGVPPVGAPPTPAPPASAPPAPAAPGGSRPAPPLGVPAVAKPPAGTPPAAPGPAPNPAPRREAAVADAEANRTMVAPADIPKPAPAAPKDDRPNKAKRVSAADLARPGLQAPSASPPSSSPQASPPPAASAPPRQASPAAAPPRRQPPPAQAPSADRPPPGRGVDDPASGATQVRPSSKPQPGRDDRSGQRSPASPAGPEGRPPKAVPAGGQSPLGPPPSARPPVDEQGATSIYRPGGG